uniref:Uncharacterized protein n=1 Tax=Anguilla anguilla TaxID=7936 RepID=A0A0E9PT96_ANGAN
MLNCTTVSKIIRVCVCVCEIDV